MTIQICKLRNTLPCLTITWVFMLNFQIKIHCGAGLKILENVLLGESCTKLFSSASLFDEDGHRRDEL